MDKQELLAMASLAEHAERFEGMQGISPDKMKIII